MTTAATAAAAAVIRDVWARLYPSATNQVTLSVRRDIPQVQLLLIEEEGPAVAVVISSRRLLGFKTIKCSSGLGMALLLLNMMLVLTNA